MYVGKKVTRVDAYDKVIGRTNIQMISVIRVPILHVFYTQQLPTDVFFLLTHLKLRRYLEL